MVVSELGNIEESVEIVNESKVMMNENLFMVVMLPSCATTTHSVFTVEPSTKSGGHLDQGEVIEAL